jgi:hypothetical protein
MYSCLWSCLCVCVFFLFFLMVLCITLSWIDRVLLLFWFLALFFYTRMQWSNRFFRV